MLSERRKTSKTGYIERQAGKEQGTGKQRAHKQLDTKTRGRTATRQRGVAQGRCRRVQLPLRCRQRRSRLQLGCAPPPYRCGCAECMPAEPGAGPMRLGGGPMLPCMPPPYAACCPMAGAIMPTAVA